MTAGDAVSTPPKSERELRTVSGAKRQLIEVAQQLAYVDRKPLYGVDVDEYDRLDGGVVRSVQEDASFRETWDEIVDVVSIIAPVDTKETTTDDSEVLFKALADGSRRTLKVRYFEEGRLEVRALWAATPRASMKMVVLDETYTLD